MLMKNYPHDVVSVVWNGNKKIPKKLPPDAPSWQSKKPAILKLLFEKQEQRSLYIYAPIFYSIFVGRMCVCVHRRTRNWGVNTSASLPRRRLIIFASREIICPYAGPAYKLLPRSALLFYNYFRLKLIIFF